MLYEYGIKHKVGTLLWTNILLKIIKIGKAGNASELKALGDGVSLFQFVRHNCLQFKDTHTYQSYKSN